MPGKAARQRQKSVRRKAKNVGDECAGDSCPRHSPRDLAKRASEPSKQEYFGRVKRIVIRTELAIAGGDGLDIRTTDGAERARELRFARAGNWI